MAGQGSYGFLMFEVSCARQLFCEEDMAAFTRGYSAVLMRVGPLSACPVGQLLEAFGC